MSRSVVSTERRWQDVGCERSWRRRPGDAAPCDCGRRRHPQCKVEDDIATINRTFGLVPPWTMVEASGKRAITEQRVGSAAYIAHHTLSDLMLMGWISLVPEADFHLRDVG